MILAGIAFALLAAIALAGLVAHRIPWQAKLVLVALVPAYGFLLWHGVSSQAGWPVGATPPDHAILVSSLVVEPSAIYLTLVPEPASRLPFDYRPSDGEPRLYRLPYSRKEAAELQRAAQAQARGQHVALRSVQRGASGTRLPRRFYRAYPFPPPLPDKEAKP